MMATDRADKPRQQLLNCPRCGCIPGSVDEPTQEVLEKAQGYVDLLSARMRQQEAEKTARDELIELMCREDVCEVQLDGYEIEIKHVQGVGDVVVIGLGD